MNIALVGAETYCKEILENTFLNNNETEVRKSIVAVSDPDPESSSLIRYALHINGTVVCFNYPSYNCQA